MPKPNPNRNSVAIEHADGNWLVLVAEDGEVTQHTYGMKEHAENFALGQRYRLGIADDETKIVDNE